MKTTFCARQPYADIFLETARELDTVGKARPEKFIRIMKSNRGAISSLTGMGLDPEGLELKNPVIVALGDSVTAGHFEGLDAIADPMKWFGQILMLAGVSPEEFDYSKLSDMSAIVIPKYLKKEWAMPALSV